VVGEAQGQLAVVDLAPLGWPLMGRLDHIEPAHQQVVDRTRSGWCGEAEALTQPGEHGGALLRSQVEVAAEDQRRLAGPFVGGGGGAQHVLDGQLGLVRGGVQVGDADTGGGAGEGHHPPLERPLVNRQLMSLDDSAPVRFLFPRGTKGAPERVSDQREVRAALARGDQIRVEAGRERAQGAERVARGQHPVTLGLTCECQRPGEARRALLQQCHVPLGRG
jgi:hypothetical protein